MNKIFPWQQPQWQYLLARKNNNTLPHALLLKGAQGMGKFIFAKAVAEFLLCENSHATSCGQCKSCHLLSINTHPDLFIVQPEEEGKTIKVEQIRELIETLTQTSQQGGYQIVIIEPAETMNIAAVNALLKTLEEPPGKILLLLVSSQPAMLPATLRSRCQLLNFIITDHEMIKRWIADKIPAAQNSELLLAIAEQAPLKALKFAEINYLEHQNNFLLNIINLCQGRLDPVKLAATLATTDLKKILFLMARLLIDLIKIKFTKDKNFFIYQNKLLELQQLATKISLVKLLQLQQQVMELNKLLNKNINLNQTLALENLLINWMI